MKPAFAFLLLLTAAVPLHAEMQTCTPAELRAHLSQLKSVVTACAKSTTKAACSPKAVGQDNRVTLPGGMHVVRYDWLRSVLASAPSSKNAKPELQAAGERLNRMLAELSSQQIVTPSSLKHDHAELRTILAGKEFPHPPPEGPLAKLRDAFFTWLNHELAGFHGTGTETGWVGMMLIGIVALAACGGLLWWFRRSLRTRRITVNSSGRPRAKQPDTEPDWQSWMVQARQLAAEQRWRESIHRVYWAAIAQMESRGSWRHDAARTPREYLALLAAGSQPREDLTHLTRYLELHWYGGLPAREQDYTQACHLLERLVKA